MLTSQLLVLVGATEIMPLLYILWGRQTTNSIQVFHCFVPNGGLQGIGAPKDEIVSISLDL